MAFFEAIGSDELELERDSPIRVHRDPSDIVQPCVTRPFTQQALEQQAACTVITPTALDAEVLSTALLAMGKGNASNYVDRIDSLFAITMLRRMG